MEKETCYKKGEKLENDFANYMKENLKYDKVRVRAHLPGKDNVKGTEADILARESDSRKDLLSDLGNISIGAFAVLVILWATGLVSEESVVVSFFIPFSIILAVASFIINHLIPWEWAWVECKNLKSKANINQVSKLIREYEDYNKVDNKEYNITKLFFVSANGFIENAIKYAENKEITCYELNKENTFIKSNYWL